MEYKYNALETAKAAMRFINTRKRQAPEGIYFSLEDGETGHASYYDEICLYAEHPEFSVFCWGSMMPLRSGSTWRRQKRLPHTLRIAGTTREH